MSNTPISGLGAGTVIADADLFPDVQAVGQGPVHINALQLKTYVGNGLTLNNPTVTGGVFNFGGWTATFPITAGTNGQVLTTNGAGVLSWSPAGVTSVAINGGLTGLSFTGSPITSSGTFSMAGTLDVNNGGTGATTPTGALLNLLPPTSPATTGYVLYNTGVGGFYWAAPLSGGGTGTVTSISGSGGTTGLTLTGGPITTAGTLTLGGTLNIANGGTGLTAVGTNGQFLSTNGSVMQWVNAPSGAITVGATPINNGTAGAIPFDNGSVFSENSSKLFWDNTNFRLGVGTNAPTNRLTVVGDYALINNALAGQSTVATDTTIFGLQAFNSGLGTGNNSTALGSYALWQNTGGANNTSVGSHSLRDTTNQNGNTAVGAYALQLNQGALGLNTAVGYNALSSGPIGDFNTSVGANSLNISSGNNNTAVGYNAGANVTSGSANTLLGGYDGSTAPINATGSNFVVLSDGAGAIRFATNAAGALSFDGSSYGSAGQVLQSNGAGAQPTWVAAGGGITVGSTTITSGTAGAIPFDNGSVFSEAPTKLFWDNTNGILIVNGNTATNTTEKFQVISSDINVNSLTVGRGGSAVATNTAVGDSALLANTVGTNNTGLGVAALTANTGGTDNTAVGAGALSTNTFGSQTTAIGAAACQNQLSGGPNTAVGYAALASNSGGTNNVAVGDGALQVNTADQNTAVGSQALVASNTGINNSAFGYLSLVSNVGGDGNTALGTASLYAIDTGSYNTGVGGDALTSIKGDRNTGVGAGAGSSVTTGSYNTFVGSYAGTATMNYNICLSDGFGNLRYQFDSNDHIWLTGPNGVSTEKARLTAAGELLIGTTTAPTVTGALLSVNSDAQINGITAGLGTGQDTTNTVFGATALAINSSSNNTAFGSNALNNSTSATGANAAFGSSALATNAGSGNTGIGHHALMDCTGSRNTAVGRLAMSFAQVQGNQNTALGISALGFVTTGSDNVAVGSQSGSGITGGSYNAIIGAYTGATAPISATGNNFIVLSDGAGNVGAYWDGATQTQYAQGPIVEKGYTFATLPAPAVIGMRAYITDASGPITFLGNASGTGAITCPVFYDGSFWVYG